MYSKIFEKFIKKCVNKILFVQLHKFFSQYKYITNNINNTSILLNQATNKSKLYFNKKNYQYKYIISVFLKNSIIIFLVSLRCKTLQDNKNNNKNESIS